MKLRAAYLSMHRAFDQLFRQYGVTADQFVLLRALAEEQGITQKELSARICSDENTVAAMISLIESKAIIRREVASSDGRARLVYLTKAGETLLRSIIRKSAGLHRVVARCFEGPGNSAAYRVLERISIATSASRNRDGRRRSIKSA